MNKIFYCCCLLLSLSCGSRDGRLSEEEKSAVVSEVKLMFQNYFDAIRNEGLVGEFKYLDHSSDFFWVPPGYKSPLSYDSIAKILNLNAPKFTSIENSFDSLRIIPLSSDLASYTAKIRSIMTDTSGTINSIQLIETGVVVRRNTVWKLSHGQTSLVD